MTNLRDLGFLVGLLLLYFFCECEEHHLRSSFHFSCMQPIRLYFPSGSTAKYTICYTRNNMSTITVLLLTLARTKNKPFINPYFRANHILTFNCTWISKQYMRLIANIEIYSSIKTKTKTKSSTAKLVLGDWTSE